MAATGELTGLRILVTRPAGQAETLCALIEAAGGVALRLPLLELMPVADSGPALELLNRPDYWHWLVFVSANAVRFALALPEWTTRPPRGSRIAVIGAATAEALVQSGIRVDLIPKPQFNSESLLAAPEFARVAGQRILIVRGQGGREHLAAMLSERGAETAYAELYRRLAPSGASRARLEQWRRSGLDAVVLTSGEALAHLVDLLGDGLHELAERTLLVVIGARLERLAREQGWRRVAVAEKAGDPSILETLIDWAGNRVGGSTGFELAPNQT